jgi:hypothetical protein
MNRPDVRAGEQPAGAAFEPVESAATLTLELVSGVPEPAVVTAPRVMVGQRIPRWLPPVLSVAGVLKRSPQSERWHTIW